MARERMVTRTVKVHNFEVMTCNTETAEVKIVTYSDTGDYNKDTDKLKMLKKRYETDTVKLVAIQHESISEILYGMPEIDFIKNAEILPPRTTAEHDEGE